MTSTVAWQWNEPGSPTSLSRSRRDLSSPSSGEALVENTVIAFNPVDYKLIEAGGPHWHSGTNWRPGRIPGVDAVGIVRSVGQGVSQSLVGRAVAYHTDLRCHGTFATHTNTPAQCLIPVPDSSA